VVNSYVANCYVASCVVANCVVASCYVANCMGIHIHYIRYLTLVVAHVLAQRVSVDVGLVTVRTGEGFVLRVDLGVTH
jgi:hypothetical protein